MTLYVVRPFEETEQEYDDLASLLRVASTGVRPVSAGELRQEDQDWPAGYLFQRVMLVSSGNVLAAVGTSYQAYWQEAPFTVHIRFDIHPEHEEAQVLSLVYAGLQRLVAESGKKVKRLASRVRENEGVRIRFLLAQGFQETMRSPTSVLRTDAADGTISEEAGGKIAQDGVMILTLNQLKAGVPDWKRRLRDLRWEIVQDVGSTDPFSKPTIDEFEEMVLQDPALDENAYFVALNAAGDLIGMSNLWRNDPSGKRLETGLTGVVRTHRRRGIATALKMRTVLYAKSSGAATIETSNEEGSAMYALNMKLGFRPGPAWLDFSKAVTSESISNH